MQDEKQTSGGGPVTGNGANPKPGFESQEKTSIGGKYNSGVTSSDEEEKRRIEKQATLFNGQPENEEEHRQAPE